MTNIYLSKPEPVRRSRAQVYACPGPLAREQGNRANGVTQPQLRVGDHVGV